MRSLTIIFCVVLVLFSFQRAQARIIHVPADSSAIQGGINGAINGDTVLVAPGTYYEHINFNGKAILVTSESGPQNTVITKVSSGLPIVTFNSSEDTTSVLDGFCIREADDIDGVAVLCYHSSPKIIRNRLTSNNVYATISCRGTHAVIVGNEITLSSVLGMWSSDYDSAYIAYNLIAKNENFGIDAYTYSYAVILNNTLDGNRLNNIFCSGSSPIIRNNIITNCRADYGIRCEGGASPHISYNDVWNNFSGDYSGCSPGIGDISADPLFCDRGNDNYYLYDTSPCLGAGQNGTDMGALGVGCTMNYAVLVTAGEDRLAFPNTQVQITFRVQNTGQVTDTYDLVVSDSLNWEFNPISSQITLYPSQEDSVIITITIPGVPIGTKDKVTLNSYITSRTSCYGLRLAYYYGHSSMWRC